MTASDVLLLAAGVAFAVLSVALTVIDARTHRLPNRIVLPAYPVGIGVLAIACALGAPWSRWWTALAGMVLLFVGYAALRMLSRTGLGGGDVKLAGVIGLALGWAGWDALLVGVFAAFLLGGLFGVALLVARRARRTTRIAFGPWMIAGAWIGLGTAWIALPAGHVMA